MNISYLSLSVYLPIFIHGSVSLSCVQVWVISYEQNQKPNVVSNVEVDRASNLCQAWCWALSTQKADKAPFLKELTVKWERQPRIRQLQDSAVSALTVWRVNAGPSIRVGEGQPPEGDIVLSSKEHQVLPRKTGRGKEIAFQSQETTQEKVTIRALGKIQIQIQIYESY